MMNLNRAHAFEDLSLVLVCMMAQDQTVTDLKRVALLFRLLVNELSRRSDNLVFSNPLELMAIAGVAFTVDAIAHDGETTWFEGVMLLAVYLLLAIAFFFVR